MSLSLAPETGRTGNLFLDTLGTASAELLLPQLERVSLPSSAPIAYPGTPLEYVIFPLGSVVSAVTTMLDGTDVEVTLVGRDGLYGVQVALGDDESSGSAMVQIPGPLFRIASARFRDALVADSALNERVLRYTQATLVTVAQCSGCNRLHPTNERCARWLLMAHDRVPADEMLLTHEYLATMLGVRRHGVSLAAAALEQAGFIEYHRGRIVMRNRAGLEQTACECYAAANGALERLLGYDVRKRSKGRSAFGS